MNNSKPNKIVFLLACAVAAAYLPAASALPAFARQTGMACSACHFQHFPLLNAYGRAFKSGGYTMMGTTQGKVEGDRLSLPDTLNMAVLAGFGYEKTDQAAGVPSSGTLNPGNGRFYVPGNGGELSLFLGGRVSDNAGFLAELGTTGRPMLQRFRQISFRPMRVRLQPVPPSCRCCSWLPRARVPASCRSPPMPADHPTVLNC